jgi:hypothetical protein
MFDRFGKVARRDQPWRHNQNEHDIADFKAFMRIQITATLGRDAQTAGRPSVSERDV